MIYFLLVPLVLLVLYALSIYNKLQGLKVRIVQSIQEIGNQLKRQAELIPNLVEAAKGMMKQEKGIFEDLTNARKSISEAASSGDVDKMSKTAEVSSKLFGSFFALMESNPAIISSTVVQDLMANLRDSSDKLMYARRLLIELTTQYNTMLVTIPSSLIASLFGFKAEKGLSTPMEGEHVTVSSEETKTPRVSL
ncbi:hypothetical protein COT51_01770 [candidate division WWE3 bacterium CG08_land_8_20_14_0_20_41_15]|uniref:LemA family protein n=1 Tax=candidate division WWE3 bacterium CG08_land_8_20_14_0_20_41_15 TaxID=1975086 RepID=A0A2H0X9K5_UNCKA|nr:MAG: hypothetical protein COT51_01770 [candidate division WWE3 bacterium CG08_land_8_20_14_0_20_41_15]